MAYVVTAPQIVAKLATGGEVYLGSGAVLPDGVDKAHLKHLLAHGLVAEVVETVEVEAPAEVGGEVVVEDDAEAVVEAVEVEAPARGRRR